MSDAAKDLWEMFGANPLESSLSPKLTWLAKHNLVTHYEPAFESLPESPEGEYPRTACTPETAANHVIAGGAP